MLGKIIDILLICSILSIIFITGFGFGQHYKANEVNASTLDLTQRIDNAHAQLKSMIKIKELAYHLQHYNYKLSKFKAEYIANLLEYSARTQGVDYKLLSSVAITESHLDETEISHKGAIGLLQIMPDTAYRFNFNPHKLKDIEYNILVGTTILGTMVDKYGENNGLRMFLCGETKGKLCWYHKDTNLYVNKILKIKETL